MAMSCRRDSRGASSLPPRLGRRALPPTARPMPTRSTSPGYFISRRTDDDSYAVWKLDLKSPNLLVPLDGAGGTFERDHTVVWIGGYLLSWGSQQQVGTTPFYQYRLVP